MKEFNNLKSELFNRKTEKFTSLSVRLTPESGTMLKALSSNEGLNISILKMFSHSISERIASDILSYYSSQKDGFNRFKQLMIEVQKDDRFRNGQSNRDAISVITQKDSQNGELLFFNDNYLKDATERVLKEYGLKKDK